MFLFVFRRHRLVALTAALAGVLVGAHSGNAQTTSAAPKYGKVDPKELSAAPYAADTGAVAVVLADVGRAYFVTQEGHFQLMFERTRRVKILDARGFGFATVRIPLYRDNGNEERVMSLKAATYRLGAGGKVEKTELKAADAVTEQIDEHHVERRFTLPAVQAGSVIEYAYTVSSNYIFNLQDWWFQEAIPVRWSEFRVQIPEYLEYAHHLTGVAPLQIQTVEPATGVFTFRSAITAQAIAAGDMATPPPTVTNVPVKNYRWVGVDMPAFRTESYITTPADYLTHVRFQLEGTRMPGQTYHDYTSTWGSVNNLLLSNDHFGGYLGVTGELGDAAKALRTSQPDLVARAAAVRALVCSRVAFDGSDRLYAAHPARKVLDLRRGNSAEINLLLVSALREAGLAAQPVILSTRAHGHIHDDLPLLDRFNFVLAEVDLPGGSTMFLDATDGTAPAGQVPVRCLNTRGRVIADTETQRRWLPVVTSHSFTHYTAGTVALRADGSATATLRREFGGYAGQAARAQLAADGAAAFATAHANLGTEAELQAHEVSDSQNPTKPLALVLTAAVPADGSGDTRFFSLAQLLKPAHGPLLAPTRQLPLDMGAPFNETVRLTVTLPDGYTTEALPAPVHLKLPDDAGAFQFMYSPSADGRSVEVMSRLTLRRAGYDPEEYAGLRALYEQLLTKHAELITVKRKS